MAMLELMRRQSKQYNKYVLMGFVLLLEIGQQRLETMIKTSSFCMAHKLHSRVAAWCEK